MTTSYSYFIPLVTIEQFSGTCGVTIRTVEAWVMRGHVPTVKIGRHRMVNVAAIVAQNDCKSLKKGSAHLEIKPSSRETRGGNSIEAA